MRKCENQKRKQLTSRAPITTVSTMDCCIKGMLNLEQRTPVKRVAISLIIENDYI